ncbi:MAG: NTP transferase domain-containing protein [Promethearchaeota archaeon]|nr:MAG: NTP transferase domain-containing protein [Candidatus Lokiarchaeota archaeon]
MLNHNKLEGLILAAGYSSRFNFMDSRFKKYFLKLNNSNILGYVIAGMIKTGIKKIKIVTSKIFNKLNYRKSILKSITQPWIDLKNLELDIIENKIPERENGYSLFLGLNTISSEYTILSMADHIFSKNIFSKMIKNYKNKDILLATDPMYKKGYYDKEDATKVYGENSFIINIGKDLKYYNRLDMGIFILKTKTIKKICNKVKSNFHKFGVTDVIISGLNSDLNVGYCDFPNTIWLDIDNYKKYRQLKRIFSKTSRFHPFGLIPTEYITFNTKNTEVNND